MRIATLLLASTSLVATVPAFAQTLPADEALPAASDSMEIVVLGQGQTRQVQELKSDDIVTLTPGTSPLKAIEKLPGVMFQAADPFGKEVHQIAPHLPFARAIGLIGIEQRGLVTGEKLVEVEHGKSLGA